MSCFVEDRAGCETRLLKEGLAAPWHSSTSLLPPVPSRASPSHAAVALSVSLPPSLPYQVYIHSNNHAGYYPGAKTADLKLLFDPQVSLLLRHNHTWGCWAAIPTGSYYIGVAYFAAVVCRRRGGCCTWGCFLAGVLAAQDCTTAGSGCMLLVIDSKVPCCL